VNGERGESGIERWRHTTRKKIKKEGERGERRDAWDWVRLAESGKQRKWKDGVDVTPKQAEEQSRVSGE